MVKMLGWVQKRWVEVLEPVVRTATVEQEKELRAFWERELQWWKTQHHLQGDSLRNPITQVRAKYGKAANDAVEQLYKEFQDMLRKVIV